MAESNGSDAESHDTVRNVVLIVLDTARACSVGDRTTPTMTGLADAGTAFDDAFAAAPWTLPSHASMFTGAYPSEHGAHGGHTYLDETLRTLPEAFADAGFQTIGVSNNTWLTEEFGFHRGFDELRKGWQYVQSDSDMGAVVRGEDVQEKLQATRTHLFDGNPFVNAVNIFYSELFQPTGDDGADRSTTWIANWLAGRTDDRPFFLFCNFIEPHVEYDPPREYAERFLPDETTYEDATTIRQDPRAYDCGEYHLSEPEFAALRGLYRAELAYVDDQLAEIRTALEDAGEWEDTLLVVCGDHGEHIGEHDFFGHQYNLYDTLINVPLVAHGGPFTDGGRRNELVQLLDLPVTVLEAAGVDDPELREQGSGRSWVPLVADSRTASTRDAVFAEYVAPQPSIERLENRFGADSIPDRVREFDRRLRAVRTNEYKYVQGSDGFERLHDVASDPAESTNVVADEPERARRLRNRLEKRFGPLSEDATDGDVEMQAGTKDRLADLGYL
ncbi:sulfatase [Natronobacterium gregoryi]|uniref:Sulfatase n=2 Tax=Natronobacterium gregoryi TaxID=44930 RepID=L0AJ19_NATGS|nr:sulfatase [Natronobacterium gregoryi]AFZ73444.1 arylsulfatase A family protein [Natronobacterium gregoryi SP2]ELY68641.1 sulfatase [Natronobacterium gregoryi SP2]PLK20485.1 sulfatase [Natronobacterium gregoryi SP2]SFI71768.1 Arylsulfatase A [Natronobacterium gregoryi]